MKKNILFVLAVILTVCGSSVLTSCDNDDNIPMPTPDKTIVISCAKPDNLKTGDRVALISPSYFTPMENVEKTADVLRSWGLEPVIGPNVGKVVDGKYAGTVAERISDICWALNDPAIKAIICNRGGYGTIQLIDQLALDELKAAGKWIVGFSDISTLHGLWNRAGVMSIHGTMSSFLAKGGTDETSTLMRDLLLGLVPRYEVPAHSQNITGTASGVLVGGNICTFAPNLGSQADATMGNDLILFIEEVEESMHNIDRQMRILQMNGVLDRCKGIILGEFTDCGTEFKDGDGNTISVEAMLHDLLAQYHIPVLCGFPAGHGDINLPLVMGAPVTIDVRTDGATLQFNIVGTQQTVNTADITATNTPAAARMMLAGKCE
jgi:muramoyltetrapeptide carboxypeptidase